MGRLCCERVPSSSILFICKMLVLVVCQNLKGRRKTACLFSSRLFQVYPIFLDASKIKKILCHDIHGMYTHVNNADFQYQRAPTGVYTCTRQHGEACCHVGAERQYGSNALLLLRHGEWTARAIERDTALVQYSPVIVPIYIFDAEMILVRSTSERRSRPVGPKVHHNRNEDDEKRREADTTNQNHLQVVSGIQVVACKMSNTTGKQPIVWSQPIQREPFPNALFRCNRPCCLWIGMAWHHAIVKAAPWNVAVMENRVTPRRFVGFTSSVLLRRRVRHVTDHHLVLRDLSVSMPARGTRFIVSSTPQKASILSASWQSHDGTAD